MFILRKEYESIKKNVPNEREQRQKLRKVKDAYGRIWDIADNTMGTHMSMIGKCVEHWEFLKRYLKGEHLQFAPKARKKRTAHATPCVKSWSGLNQIAPLNDDNLAKLMTEILTGKLQMPQVTKRVRRMLADQYVRHELLTYFGAKNWASLAAAEPELTSPDKVESYVNLILPSAGTKFQITKDVLQGEDVKTKIKRDRALLQVFLYCFFLSNIIIFLYSVRLRPITSRSRSISLGELSLRCSSKTTLGSVAF